VDRVTGHVDVVPTLLGLLGDRHDPERIGDGLRMYDVPADRYVLASVGWDQKFALVGPELKAVFRAHDAGFGGVQVTDPEDRPLPDAEARFAAEAPKLLRRLRGRVLPSEVAQAR
jgi:membrane-anchored protein YejM (alkaline phosphatase superfamily)